MSICLLLSGHLGFTVLKFLLGKHSISSVFTDKNSAEIIDFCEVKKIPLFIGNPRGGRSAEFRSKIHCDILLSINYLFIIDRDLIQYPSKYAINFHGSLLPKYRGRTPHVWAIIHGEVKTGITGHLITEELDAGDIVFQKEIPILPEDTGYTILQKYFYEYPLIIETVLQSIENGSIKPYAQDHLAVTFFPKRTPEDGKINWDWNRERILNWIRALAPPYPGAFTFSSGTKLLIKQGVLSDIIFSDSDKNGKILKIQGPQITVKTINGALTIFLDGNIITQLKTGEILA